MIFRFPEPLNLWTRKYEKACIPQLQTTDMFFATCVKTIRFYFKYLSTCKYLLNSVNNNTRGVFISEKIIY